jgi:peptide/nickel transport system permease protein
VKSGIKLSPSGWIGIVMIGTFVVLGVIGPWIAPYDPNIVDLSQRFLPSSADHCLGTDSKGIDALSQLLWGARSALQISISVVSISATIGIAVGTLAGWFRGVVDEVLMRIVDILMAFPGILLNIAVVATVARPGLGVMIAALCLNGWVGYARVARGETLGLRERDYVLA